MLAALYGGFRSGLLATVLSAAVADYFWMEPVGQFSMREPADGLSLAIFLLSGLMISWVTDGTRRAQARTAQAEAEAKVAVERAQAGELLRQKEAELRQAQHIAQIGSWFWDAKTDVTIGSDELMRIYGFDPASQAMPNFKDQRGRCYPVEDWERVNAAVQRTLETGAGYELDVQAFRNGVPIWVTTRGELVRNADGRIAGLRGTVQDITERKRAEEALRESEARLRRLMEMVPIPLGVVNKDGEMVFVNDHFVRVFGYTQADVPTLEAWWQRAYPDAAYRRRVRENWEAKMLRTAETHAESEPEEFNVACKDGTVRVVVISNIIIEGNILATFTDITERKRAEEVAAQAGGGGAAHERAGISLPGGGHAADRLGHPARWLEHLFQSAMGGLHRDDDGGKLRPWLEHALPPR